MLRADTWARERATAIVGEGEPMSWLAYAAGVLIAALGVALSIALHEVGHLVPGQALRVRVTQYMVGFGPAVWSRRRGKPRIGLKAIPLGGYIRMIGMFPPKPGDAPEPSGRRARVGSASWPTRPRRGPRGTAPR